MGKKEQCVASDGLQANGRGALMGEECKGRAGGRQANVIEQNCFNNFDHQYIRSTR